MRRFIGTQYYRPPNPPKVFWASDLEEIRARGFKLVRTWLYWSQVNRRPGLWDYSSYDEFIELATGKGLKVLVQLVPESAPLWFVSEHPDAMYVKNDGTKFTPGACGMMTVGSCRRRPG